MLTFFYFKYYWKLKVMDTEETVWNILTEPIKSLGYNLIRVKMIGSNKLQIMAERLSDKGLDINDCVKISKFASVLFEKENTINFDFALEVSSPGINRPLINIDDYRNHLGSYVDIKLKKIVRCRTVPQIPMQVSVFVISLCFYYSGFLYHQV